SRGKVATLATLGGLYAAASVWAYFAWYRDVPEKPFLWGGDGGFGVNTYAGGADKMGHFWSDLAITRSTSEMLMAGGWRPLPATLIAGGLSAFAFTMVEVKDGYYYEFSFGDLTADYLGVAAAATLENFPAIDRLFDLRLDYWPSKEYLEILRGE